MIRLIAGLVGAALTFALLMLAAMQVGARGDPPPTLLARIVGCDLACWNEIVFNLSDLPAANRWLDANGLSGSGRDYTEAIPYRDGGSRCQVVMTYRARALTTLRFAGCGDIRLGDLLLKLGSPDSVIATGGSRDWLLWHGGLLDVTAVKWTSPVIPVDSIGLKAAISVPVTGTNWHGFMPIWRYCQFESAPYPCRNPKPSESS